MTHSTQSPMNLLRAGVGLALALTVTFTVAACKNQSGMAQGGAAGTGKTAALTGAGATFPYPLYSKWFDDFGKSSGTQINYQSIGSGGGIKQLKEKTVDFGASDAPLTDAELAEMPAPVVYIPTVAGAVALTYNLPNVPAGLKLSPQVVAGLFLGDIKKWNAPEIAALNPDIALPDLAVTVAHRSDGSGTSYIFTSYLAAISETWKNTVGAGKSVNWPVGIAGKGNEGVAGVLKQSPGAIGYVELAYAEQNKLTYAAIQNKAGAFITPSVDSTTAAAAGAVQEMGKDIRVSIVDAPGKDAYPISGFTYVLVYKEQPDKAKGTSLVNFLWWAIHEGQTHAKPLVYAPLPEAVVKLDEKALQGITNGGTALHPAQ